MAYQSCAADLAANIALNCASPLVGGYTGRAVIVQYKDAPTIVQDATNPRKIRSITLGSGVKTIVVDNAFVSPFDGSNTAGNADTGRTTYTKQLSMRIPLRGADTSKNIVEPLSSSAGGFLVVVEKKDKTADGAFEVIGFFNPMKATPDSISRNENENGGDIAVTLETNEPYFEVTLCAQTSSTDDYEASKAIFETLWAAAV